MQQRSKPLQCHAAYSRLQAPKTAALKQQHALQCSSNSSEHCNAAAQQRTITPHLATLRRGSSPMRVRSFLAAVASNSASTADSRPENSSRQQQAAALGRPLHAIGASQSLCFHERPLLQAHLTSCNACTLNVDATQFPASTLHFLQAHFNFLQHVHWHY